MRVRTIGMIVGVVAFVVSPVWADWDPGDPHKMHWPQLPDPNGWDVDATWPQKVLADDWLCTETGPVTDIHLWGSWEYDHWSPIHHVHVSIHADNGLPVPDSRPLDPPLWERDFFPGQFTVRDYGQGPQGWFDPYSGMWRRPDHLYYHQININPIPDPFIQQYGTKYWLDISVMPVDPQAKWGWKTTLNPWADPGVFFVPGAGWLPLRDPITSDYLHLAFVITPEPASLLLLALGGLALRRR